MRNELWTNPSYHNPKYRVLDPQNFGFSFYLRGVIVRKSNGSDY